MLQSMGSQRVGHDLVTEQQQMVVVRVVIRVVRGLGFLPGESHGQRSLVGHSQCGRKELDTTEQLNRRHHTVQAGKVCLFTSWQSICYNFYLKAHYLFLREMIGKNRI